MAVDTGAFQARTAQIAELTEQVRHLVVKEVGAEAIIQAGFATGEARTREAMLGRAVQASRPAALRRSHLRVVVGGAS